MKSQFNEITTEQKYPCLKISKNEGIIVLFCTKYCVQKLVAMVIKKLAIIANVGQKRTLNYLMAQ